MIVLGQHPVVSKTNYILPEVVELTCEYNEYLQEKGEAKPSTRFFAGLFTISHSEWAAFCADTGRRLPDDNGYGRGKLPVASIRDLDVIHYCNWLNSKAKVGEVDPNHPQADMTIADYNEFLGLPRDVYKVEGNKVYENEDSRGYRLPLISEWQFMLGDAEEQVEKYGMCKVGWTLENSGGKPQIPGQLMANRFGLYDMLGNFLEICVAYAEQ